METTRVIHMSDDVTYQGLMEALHKSSYKMGEVQNNDRACRSKALEDYAEALLALETFMEDDRRRSINTAYLLGKGEIK